MIHAFFNQFKHMDKKIFSIIKCENIFSLIICLFSIFILIYYDFNPISFDTYYIGILLFKTGLMFAVEFIICGFAIDIIKKQLE